MKFVVGAKVTTPPALTAILPLGTLKFCGVPGVSKLPLMDCTVNVLLSTSVSFAARVSTRGVSSMVLKVSVVAIGASLAPLMVMVRLAVAVLPSPSVMV